MSDGTKTVYGGVRLAEQPAADEPDDRLERLARHLYNIAAGKLGMVQAISWDHLTPYWRTGYRLLASEAIKYMARQEDKGERTTGTGQAG